MYGVGCIFKFDYVHDGIIEKGHEFTLIESDDSLFVFRILCSKGFHKGEIEGYVKFEKEGANNISETHLINELKRNFLEIKWSTFKIIKPNP